MLHIIHVPGKNQTLRELLVEVCRHAPYVLSLSLSLGMLWWQILCDAAPQVKLDFSRGNCQSQKVTTELIFKFSTLKVYIFHFGIKLMKYKA